jgi:short-chain fatty acids transporter
MIRRLGAACTELSRRFMPDPFLFALLLTFVTIALAWGATGRPLGEVLRAWGGSPWQKGFWALLEFSMQMCLVLVTGHALATARPVRRALEAIASRPRSTASGAALVSFVSMASALVNWGFGLIVGAVLAKEVARSGRARGVKMHYPLLGAAGFTGLFLWHGGFSGSAPLKVAAEAQPIPIAATLFSPLNVTLCLIVLATAPGVLYLMAPRREEDVVEITDAQAAPPAEGEAPPERTPAAWIERSPAVTALACAAAAYVAFLGFREKGLRFVDLYAVPFLFLFLGLALHGRPIRYMRAVNEAVKGCGGIVAQFPFYAGIAGIMSGTGLGDQITAWIVRGSSPATFPVLAWLSACLVNFFIPSGGGQWAVQGPIVLRAGLQHGLDPGRCVLYVAHGDDYTNMLGPFWVLPLLGVTGLQAREVMGYATALMLVEFPVFLACIALL